MVWKTNEEWNRNFVKLCMFEEREREAEGGRKKGL